ncbi:DsrE family protein [Mangrovimonas xylaniphaga]|uniref:DsrE family protein n=1 Tax=Mangrovimonas xylaniphaga TaxID=1645915 RepID=UPI0006B418D6|nr:DsrE family protein [Mangrovimonas xylaniphaga]
MKHKLFYIAFICLLSIGSNSLFAQDFDPEKNNYLILSKNIQQLNPVLITANDLEKEDGKAYGDFYVILCGKTVSDIPNNPEFEKLLKDAKSQNIKVFVCGISMKKFNVDQKQLPKNITVVENGILYGFQLTKQGFNTLTI